MWSKGTDMVQADTPAFALHLWTRVQPLISVRSVAALGASKPWETVALACLWLAAKHEEARRALPPASRCAHLCSRNCGRDAPETLLLQRSTILLVQYAAKATSSTRQSQADLEGLRAMQAGATSQLQRARAVCGGDPHLGASEVGAPDAVGRRSALEGYSLWPVREPLRSNNE